MEAGGECGATIACRKDSRNYKVIAHFLNFTDVKSKIEIPITGVYKINSLEDVCQFYSDLVQTFGFSWHPDDRLDALDDCPGGHEEADRIDKLMEEAFNVSLAAGIEDPYELAFASTRKIREPFGLGTDYEEPLAVLFK